MNPRGIGDILVVVSLGVSVVRGTEGSDRVRSIGLKGLEKKDDVLILGPFVTVSFSLFPCRALFSWFNLAAICRILKIFVLLVSLVIRVLVPATRTKKRFQSWVIAFGRLIALCKFEHLWAY